MFTPFFAGKRATNAAMNISQNPTLYRMLAEVMQ